MGRRGTIGIGTVLLVAAVLCFLIAAFVDTGDVNLLALGLALFAGAFLIRDVL
jgi:hypothetical protein